MGWMISSTPTAPDCPAGRHGTYRARARYGCTCPEAIEDVRAANRRRSVRLNGIGAGRPARPDPEGYVDDIAVERACGGELLTLTVPERTAAVAELTRHGLSARQIAIRLRIAPRTVQRYRSLTR